MWCTGTVTTTQRQASQKFQRQREAKIHGAVPLKEKENLLGCLVHTGPHFAKEPTINAKYSLAIKCLLSVKHTYMNVCVIYSLVLFINFVRGG